MASTVWRGYITFGLISIPVRIFRAARPERVNLKQLYRVRSPEPLNQAVADEANEPEDDAEPAAAPSPSRTGAGTLRSGGPQPVPYRADRSAESDSATSTPEVLVPVRRVAVDQSDESIVPQRALTKGYEYEKDRFVALDPEELKSIVPKTATEMEILEFVKLDDIDPVYFEASYYVQPEAAGEKPYALLYQALQKTRLVAIAKFAMHSREHVVVLRPGKRGLISHTMYFQSEVRGEQEYRADTDLIEGRDLDLAEKLIHSLAAEFEPEKYKDTYREKLEALIQSKVEGKRVSQESAPSRRAPVVDMTEALRRSLALVKKPPHSAGELAEDSPKVAGTRKRSGRTRAQAK
jgi:DNA end-binding protein Ku